MRKEPNAVAADALRAELMAVPGVASAEVDIGESEAPAGVRVRLTPDADARRVGADVQRVLASHGMRSRFSDPAPEADPVTDVRPPVPEAEVSVTPPPPVEAPPTPEIPPVPETPPPPIASVIPMAAVPNPPAGTPPQRVIVGGLRSVAVEERADGLGVIVTLDDDRTGSTRLTSGGEGEALDSAVIAAVAAAVGLEVEAVATEWMELDDGSVVTVVLRLTDGALVAGAGVVRVGRAYAVGIATRAALEV